MARLDRIPYDTELIDFAVEDCQVDKDCPRQSVEPVVRNEVVDKRRRSGVVNPHVQVGHVASTAVR